MSFSVFSLGPLSSSFCIEIGENSEKSNNMLSATSNVELGFFMKFLDMSQFQNRLILLYQKLPLHWV